MSVGRLVQLTSVLRWSIFPAPCPKPAKPPIQRLPILQLGPDIAAGHLDVALLDHSVASCQDLSDYQDGSREIPASTSHSNDIASLLVEFEFADDSGHRTSELRKYCYLWHFVNGIRKASRKLGSLGSCSCMVVVGGVNPISSPLSGYKFPGLHGPSYNHHAVHFAALSIHTYRIGPN